MSIAWSFLTDIQQAQLLRFKPELQFEHDLAVGVLPRCPRGCGGRIFRDDGVLQCNLCERVFDERGEEIKAALGNIEDMRQGVGFRHG